MTDQFMCRPRLQGNIRKVNFPKKHVTPFELTASNGLVDRYAIEIEQMGASNGLRGRYAIEIEQMGASNGLRGRYASEIERMPPLTV